MRILGADTPVLSPQKPILLQGHERSITQIKYNREGDLLFTVAKDPVSCVPRAGGRDPSEGPGRGGHFAWVMGGHASSAASGDPKRTPF